MNYKVIVTAKKSGVGTLSKEHGFTAEPSASDLRNLQRSAKMEFKNVYGTTSGVAVDITVRPERRETRE